MKLELSDERGENGSVDGEGLLSTDPDTSEPPPPDTSELPCGDETTATEANRRDLILVLSHYCDYVYERRLLLIKQHLCQPTETMT